MRTKKENISQNVKKDPPIIIIREEPSPKRTLGFGLLLLAVINGAIAVFGIVKREPDAPVTWRELSIVLIVQAILLTAIAIRILWFNYSHFG